MSVIDFEILYFNDPDKASSLAFGKVYVGEPGLDPVPIGNQKPLNIMQENGTVVPISQPMILSAGGNPVYNGSTVRLDVDGNYSIKILNSDDGQEYYIDNVFEGEPVTLGDLPDINPVWNFTELDYAVTSTDTNKLYDGASLNIKERTTGNGGGAMWDAVLSSTVTENTYNIVQCTGVGALSLVLRDSVEGNVLQWGMTPDGGTDNTTLFIYMAAELQAENISGIYFPKGDYLFTKAAGLTTCLRWVAPSPFKFQGEQTALRVYGDGSESLIIIDNRVETVTWMAGPEADNVPDVFVEKLGFTSKTIYDSASERTTYLNNYLTMPTYGKAFNCGRMWRCTIQDCFFEYVLPFYHSDTDPDSAGTFTQQLSILRNHSVQHQEQAIDFFQCWSTDIIGNHFESGNRGIKVAQSNFIASFGLRIHENTIQGNGLSFSGIRINHGYALSIKNNYLESNRTSTGVASVNLWMNDNSEQSSVSIEGNFFTQAVSDMDGFGEPYYHVNISNVDRGLKSIGNQFTGGNGYLASGISYIESTDLVTPQGGAAFSEGALIIFGSYETGTIDTWTPILSDASTSGNVAAMTLSDNRYTVNGKQVTVTAKMLSIDTTGMTGANEMFVQSLPFSGNADTEHLGQCNLDSVAFSGYVNPYLRGGDDYLNFRNTRENTSDLNLKVQDFTSGSADVILQLTYFID